MRVNREKAPRNWPNLKRSARLILLIEIILNGQVAYQAELARLGHVTRARMTQIMNLLNLAPDIQEAVLFLPELVEGRGLTERELRAVVAEVDWGRQKAIWSEQFEISALA